MATRAFPLPSLAVGVGGAELLERRHLLRQLDRDREQGGGVAGGGGNAGGHIRHQPARPIAAVSR
jgi:hypothetical protein